MRPEFQSLRTLGRRNCQKRPGGLNIAAHVLSKRIGLRSAPAPERTTLRSRGQLVKNPIIA
jgi:hypothetical protein